jgi:hypothetical protein
MWAPRLLLPLLLPLLATPTALACNRRTIVLHGNMLGGECCGPTPRQKDTGSNATNLPPSWTTSPSPTDTTTPKGPVVIPVGDCVCGTRINVNQTGQPQLNRPWAVHIVVAGGSQQEECSGSLLNRRWIVSAAHCFCGRLAGLSCGLKEHGFAKEANRDSLRNGPVVLRFGTTPAAKRNLQPRKNVERVVIHPNYWQGGEAGSKAGGMSYDLALIKAGQDVYAGDGTVIDGQTVVQPICLPPPGPVDGNLVLGIPATAGGETKTDAGVGTKTLAIELNFMDPFNDMDCALAFEEWSGVPRDTHVNVGTLRCHPAEFTEEHDTVNIGGKTSYLTAFGSTSQVNKKVCRASSYSPDRSVFRECRSRCNREDPNPSLKLAVCSDLQRQDGLLNLTKESLQNVVRYVVKSSNGSDVYCYPFSRPAEVESMGRRPFKTGWCEVECGPSEGCQAGQAWGWCTEGCDDETPR